MHQNKISILCTRPLDDSLIKTAKQLDIDIDVLSFIETTAARSIDEQQEIETALLKPATVVFTSMNAVDAVTMQLDGQQPHWNIFCIGNTTNKLVQHYFGNESVAGTADSAAELAGLIVEKNDIGEVIFFCGDKRRDELPEILRKNDIEVNEIVVYQTLAVPHKIEKQYHGILFFSPSAVESFFSINKLPATTLLFAIGNTTANEIKKYTGNKIITGDEPGKENLVNKMIEHFT
jgi:uroporphyrinogen-III synthase